eukprot:NODE_286_length_11757_cov_0.187768.p10 type:complete len:116 gc:universal NODE_286_length_11757_cov_0.187768:2593-2940(+)
MYHRLQKQAPWVGPHHLLWAGFHHLIEVHLKRQDHQQEIIGSRATKRMIRRMMIVGVLFAEVSKSLFKLEFGTHFINFCCDALINQEYFICNLLTLEKFGLFLILNRILLSFWTY